METKEKRQPAGSTGAKRTGTSASASAGRKTSSGSRPASSGTRSSASGSRPASAGGKAGATSSGNRPSAGHNKASASVAAPRKRKAASGNEGPVYKRKRPKPQRKKQLRPAADVVYTQPDPFNRNRFLLRLLTVAAVVLALFLGMSIFFKVETVMVSGAEKYTPWEVRQASGIEEGENLLALNEAMIGGRIKTALPYVSRVRVGIKLPDTVNIEITEVDVTYAVESKNDGWWLITGEGKIMENILAPDRMAYTRILGVVLETPVAGEQAIAWEPEPETTAPADLTAPSETSAAPTVPDYTQSERLRIALDIVQYLESNGVLGDADEVNVSDMGQLQIKFGEQYVILLGEPTRLGYKIQMMKNTIDQLGDHYSGTLDVSYTLRPEEVVYTPFS